MLFVATLIGALALAYRPVGDYLHRVVSGTGHSRVERGIYRLVGVNPAGEQSWGVQARSVLAFSAVSLLFLYPFLRLQDRLWLSLGLPAVTDHVAWNTAVSFTTNTNWQAYSGESTMGHLVQLTGLAVQAFVSAAVGIAVAVALVRGFARSRSVTIALEGHAARLQASVATIAHQERPELLDRLAVLRDQVFVLDHMYTSVFSTCGWILRLAVTVALLMTVHPALALLALFALPTVLTSSWRPAVERGAEERGAPASRLACHLFVTATTAAPGKEVRLAGIGPKLVRQRRVEWERWYAVVAPARWGTAVWHTLAWEVFGAGYVGAIVFVSSVLHAPPSQVLLVLAAGARLSAQVAATVGEIGFLRGIWKEATDV